MQLRLVLAAAVDRVSCRRGTMQLVYADAFIDVLASYALAFVDTACLAMQ
jgi:hypothetical protein